MDNNACVWANLLKQPQKIVSSKSNATCGGLIAVASKVDEHRATAPCDPRTVIVVDLDDEVVKIVRPHQPVARFPRRSPDRTVIPPIRRVFAPGIGRANRTDR